MKVIAAACALVFAATGLPAAAEPLLVGVYTGLLPCADCSGIQTELTLTRKASGWAEGRYLLKQTYIGRKVAPLVKTGDWTTLRGSAADYDDTVYELDPDDQAHATHFLKIREATIKALDKDLKPLPAGLPSTLKRQTKGLPSVAAVNCIRRGGIPSGKRCGKA